MATWAVPQDFPWYLEVSDDGRVRTLDHTIIRKNGSPLSVRGRELKTYLNGAGYPVVRLSFSGESRIYRVHRLVLLAHVGAPKSGQIANHKNGIRSDARVGNLEWCSQQENCQHAYDVLGRRAPWKGKMGFDNASSIAVVAIPNGGGAPIVFGSQMEAGRNGFSQPQVSVCLAGKQHDHRGYRWKRAVMMEVA